ncbi:MAG: PAS domain S-box protein [Magnetospirillum sp.]|nr:PAS domain S-box protein [Magnetospirillum sp.]
MARSDLPWPTPALAGNPEILAWAVAAAPVGMVVADAHHPGNPVLYVNDEFTAITGYTAEEVVGRSLRMLQGPGSDAAAVADLHDGLAARRPVAVEILNYRKDGSPFWMGVRIRPVYDDAGQLVAFVGALADVTARRTAEAEIRMSAERLRALAESIPLPMITVGADETVVEANEDAELCLGTSGQSLIGRPVADFSTPGDEGCERLCEEMRRDGARRVEMRIRRDDGTPLWVLASARRYIRNGEVCHLVVFHDVTPLKRKEQALTEANEKAERAIRARMQFLAAASHDLRQPLQALALFAAALDHHVGSAQGRSIVQSMKTSLRGMEEQFEALLDMSRLDAGVMTAEPQLFLINDVFEQLENTYATQAAAAGLDLRVVPSSVAVKSDPRLLARILGNFLSNAIRYTPSGRVLLGVRLRGDQVRIEVRDSGPGIEESRRLEIFREFHQVGTAAPSGRGSGLGLGLAIVQRLARLLGHRLDVASVMGKGTAFSVAVPMAEDWVPGRLDAAANDDESRDVAGATVVVVDDDRDIQDALAMILEDWGCHPVVAATAGDAIAGLDRSGLQPDVILADLHLVQPRAGIAVIHAIIAHSGRPVPAFLFTGDTEAPASADLGFPVLRKPLDPMRLRAVLSDALGR